MSDTPFVFWPPCKYFLDGRVYEHCAPSYFEINASSPGARKGISLIQPRSTFELALQIGTSTLRFELPNSLDWANTDSVTISDIPCTLPEGGQILCDAEFTAYPLNIRLSAAPGVAGFDWFWLNVQTSISAWRESLDIPNLNQYGVLVASEPPGPVTRSMSRARLNFHDDNDPYDEYYH